MSKYFPLNHDQLKELTKKYPTPFYLYDEKSIRENMRYFTKAFSAFPEFREYFAVKACPNPYILKVLESEGAGGDCSSLPELLLCEKSGITGKRHLSTEYLTHFNRNLEEVKPRSVSVHVRPSGIGELDFAQHFIDTFGSLCRGEFR